MNLPGAYRGEEFGHCCDCGDEQECSIVQGETDSFGYETNLFCDKCLKKLREEAKNRKGECEWCHAQDQKLYWTRDIDEGMYGPVYEVCESCYKKQTASLRKELEDRY